MTNVDSPLMEALLHARANHPNKSALLQSLLALLPDHSVDMQATIDIDETLQEVLQLAALDPDVNEHLTGVLLKQYGLKLPLDPSATNVWRPPADNDSTFDFPNPSQPTKPIAQQPSLSETPSLSHIINNSQSASVWVANDPVLHRPVVLKEYSPADCNSDTHTHNENQFLQEAQITGQLEHPNIIPVYAVSWNQDGRPYYTMKHLDGDTLAESIHIYHTHNTRHSIRSLRPLLDIFSNVCRAIAYAHNRGVIHRDIKPSNIAIGSYGEVMVIDWGLGTTDSSFSETATENAIAPNSLHQDASQTMHGKYQGTPNYMSPEQVTGGTLTCCTDIYSLGGVLFSILTAQPPRNATSQSPPLSELLDDIVSGSIPTPNSVEPTIPIELGAIVNKAMQRDPERRYQNVTSLLTDLQAVMADEAIAVCPDTIPRAVARWIRKHPTLVSIGFTVLTLGLFSVSISNFVIEKSNEQTRVLLKNSQVLTREGMILQNELLTEHDKQAAAKKSALTSQTIAIQQRRVASKQATLANSARSDASQQLELATKLSMDALRASTHAATAKREAYAALEKTKILKNKSQQLAAIIRGEHVRQLTSHARNLIDLNRQHEAILPLITAITTPDMGGDRLDQLLTLTNSLMSQGVALSNVELTNNFSVNLLPRAQAIRATDLSCVSSSQDDKTYQILWLPPFADNRNFAPTVRDVSTIPVAVLHNDNNDTLVLVMSDRNATSIEVYPMGTSTPPLSFNLGIQATSAILSNSQNQIIVGTNKGGGYSVDVQTGALTVILPDMGSPITDLSLHANSSIAAFASKSTIHIVTDPLDTPTRTESLQLPDSVAAMQFNSAKSLIAVTSRGYVLEYFQLPSATKRTRYRPPTSTSRLRNICVHPSGAMLLDHSSNHLTLLDHKLTPTTVQSPLTISVSSMAFSSDGQFALTTTDRRITTIWDCESLQPRNLPMQSDHQVIAMELDIRNQSLFTIHSDASLRTWRIPADNTIGMDNNNPLLKPSITSTLERFQLMLSVRSTDTGLGVTSAEAKRLLASQPNATKN